MVDGRIVFRQADADQVGRELATAIGKVWDIVSTILITGIGELVTNDPARHDGRTSSGSSTTPPS